MILPLKCWNQKRYEDLGKSAQNLREQLAYLERTCKLERQWFDTDWFFFCMFRARRCNITVARVSQITARRARADENPRAVS